MRRHLALVALLLTAAAVPGAAGAARTSGPLPRTTLLTTPGADGWSIAFEATDAARTEYRVDQGPWRTYAYPRAETLFDGTAASFARWQHLGAGSFELTKSRTMRTSGGLGMLWYPGKQFGSAEFRTRWRALPPPAGSSETASRGNSGMVVRFPDPVAMTSDPTKRQECQGSVGLGSQGLFLPEYAALVCGNEIQINDASPADPQRTGSVYDFDFLHDPEQRPVPAGRWVDYVVRVTGGEEYTVTVLRDGHQINQWVNTPGQLGWRSGCYCGLPAEYPGDTPSDLRRFAHGFFGLQNHGGTDVVEFGPVTVQPLVGDKVTLPDGPHEITYRSVSPRGVVEKEQRLVVGADVVTLRPGSCTATAPTAGTAPVTCSYVASGPGSFDARTTGVWQIRLTRGGSTWVVANHTSAPSLQVQGAIPSQSGDTVTVTLGTDLVSERDDNVPADLTTGSVQAGDG